MTDTPKFTVVDRRKFRAEDDSAASTPTAPQTPEAAASEAAPKTTSTPRLTLVEPSHAQKAEEPAVAVAEVPDESPEGLEADLDDAHLPQAPSPEELSLSEGGSRHAHGAKSSARPTTSRSCARRPLLRDHDAPDGRRGARRSRDGEP